MGKIPGWSKSPGRWVWTHDRYRMSARIEGSRGGWVGIISDEQWNRFNFQYGPYKFSRVRDELIEQMREISRRVR